MYTCAFHPTCSLSWCWVSELLPQPDVTVGTSGTHTCRPRQKPSFTARSFSGRTSPPCFPAPLLQQAMGSLLLNMVPSSISSWWISPLCCWLLTPKVSGSFPLWMALCPKALTTLLLNTSAWIINGFQLRGDFAQLQSCSSTTGRPAALQGSPPSPPPLPLGKTFSLPSFPILLLQSSFLYQGSRSQTLFSYFSHSLPTINVYFFKARKSLIPPCFLDSKNTIK